MPDALPGDAVGDTDAAGCKGAFDENAGLSMRTPRSVFLPSLFHAGWLHRANRETSRVNSRVDRFALHKFATPADPGREPAAAGEMADFVTVCQGIGAFGRLMACFSAKNAISVPKVTDNY